MWVYNYTIEVSMELQNLSPENRPLIGLTVLCVPPGQTFPKFLDHPSISPSKTSRCLKTLTGWWYTYPSEKYEFVKWEFISPISWESHSKFHGSSHHQPVEELDGVSWSNTNGGSEVFFNQSVGPAQLVEAQKQRRLNSLP